MDNKSSLEDNTIKGVIYSTKGGWPRIDETETGTLEQFLTRNKIVLEPLWSIPFDETSIIITSLHKFIDSEDTVIVFYCPVKDILKYLKEQGPTYFDEEE